LRIKIKEIPESGYGVDRAIAPEELRDALKDEEADFARSVVAISLVLHKVGEDIVVNGRLKATLGVSCVACLGPTRFEANVPLNAVFRPEADEDDQDADPQSEDVFPHDRKEVDLWPMVREQIILALPMSVRCREQCKGLCPTCGADRNTTDCGHQPPEIKIESSPLAALKDLKLQS
jgi:uncharacterized protein